MDNYTIDNKLIEEVRAQFRLWAMFLNTGIGLLSFSLGLACLGTNVPWLNACLSILVVWFVRVQGTHYFPAKIESLRHQAKENDKARILLKGLESEFFSLKVLVKDYPLFLIGFVFLVVIASSPMIADRSPWFMHYFVVSD